MMLVAQVYRRVHLALVDDAGDSSVQTSSPGSG